MRLHQRSVRTVARFVGRHLWICYTGGEIGREPSGGCDVGDVNVGVGQFSDRFVQIEPAAILERVLESLRILGFIVGFFVRVAFVCVEEDGR